MGRGTIRAGAPVAATEAVTGADNDLADPRIVTFDPPVRPCLIRLQVAVQATTAPILLLVNAEVVGVTAVTVPVTAATATHALSSILETIDLSEGGQVAVHSVSIASQHNDDEITEVVVQGWRP